MKIQLFVLACCVLIITPSVFAEEKVPDWIKNNAGWWADALISDNEFVNAVEFLINEGTIQVDAKIVSEKSDSIPDWVRNTAGWWATNQISETEFLNAIEFLIESGLINISSYNCDQNEDHDRNGVPDLIETTPIIPRLSSEEWGNSFAWDASLITDKNWSNCYFPKDLSHYEFKRIDFSYSDFSDAKLFGTQFSQSNLQGADFSNTDLRGSVFILTDLSYTNFEGANFSSYDWEEPFVTFTYDKEITIENLSSAEGITNTSSCYYQPCSWATLTSKIDFFNILWIVSFGKNIIPTNLALVDYIDDMSDRRTIWRHHSTFFDSEMLGTIFTGSNLTYASFAKLDINNADFTGADLSNAIFDDVNFTNVKSTGDLLSGTVGSEGMTYPANTDQYISNKKFETLRNLDGDDFSVVFDHALDYPPINWSMGMTIYNERLYVADTDNHRIIVYDLENNEKLLTFTSPIQKYCERSEVCALMDRNLPSSIAVIDEKIFVAYGWQDQIQVFDLNGNFLWKFGSSGAQAGQFNTPYRIAALNNELFVADLENHRIQVFALDGSFLREFETYNEVSGQHGKPFDVNIYDNQIFVIEQTGNSILVFDLNGEFIKEFTVNQNAANTSVLYGIFVYDDLIFVSDVGDSSVKIFDLDGNLVKQFGQYGDRYGEFKHPSLAITDGNRIFVSDAENYRIQIFNIIP